MEKLRYIAGGLVALFCLWVSYNAMVQTREVSPGETRPEILRSLILGRPGGGLCPASVHERYVAAGPDGRLYPTWHPPFDRATGCYFDHEHGSDPHSYVGFGHSGMPLFGYTSHQAEMVEPHKGYKVFVTNNDLNGHAWMILLNQETGDPGRTLAQFHTVDWHISTLAGEALVDIHVLGDFGFAIQNCSGGKPIPGSEQEARYTRSKHPRRIILTANCASDIVYEKWDGFIQVGGVFEAKPLFDVDNPATAVDLTDLSTVRRTCEFRPIDEGCLVSEQLWSGNVRSVMHPGQWVHNDGPEIIYTDPYGSIEASSSIVGEYNPNVIRQFVTRAGWDTRQCCEDQVVFRLQSFSGGVFIADPQEPAGMVEFEVGR